jgi:hypothetical protein
LSSAKKEIPLDPDTIEISSQLQSLLPAEDGWAIRCQGSTLVDVLHQGRLVGWAHRSAEKTWTPGYRKGSLPSGNDPKVIAESLARAVQEPR